VGAWAHSVVVATSSAASGRRVLDMARMISARGAGVR
jgi:hypothetical protein